MHYKDLVKLNNVEILKKMEILKKESFNLRVQHATKTIENTARISSIRKDIARLKTIQRLRLNNL